VRLARTQIICLQNDLKELTRNIEDGLEKYFTDAKDVGPSTSSGSSKLPPQMQKLSLQEEKPFLVVTLVDSDSPGFEAGILQHDLILKFGSFTHSNFTSLAEIGELVKNSQNQKINVKIRRDGTKEMELIIIPKVWSGQGLLGFKINELPRN
jgi:26S proteasome regulatory subunit N4